MINAVRTWLLNFPGDGTVDPAQGGEYVPVYTPIVLPQALSAVRAALFGADPDRLYANYRARQYLTILHAGDHADHVYCYDPRITYDPAPASPAFSFGLSATPLGHAHPLAVSGRLAADDVRGRASYGWTVTKVADSDARSLPPSADPTVPATDSPLLITDGLSAPVPLPGATLSVAIPDDAPDGSAWRVEAAARPGAGPLEAAAGVLALGRDAASALFGETPAEPYLTYSNLWHGHPEVAGRLTGVLLALARRTGELSGAARV